MSIKLFNKNSYVGQPLNTLSGEPQLLKAIKKINELYNTNKNLQIRKVLLDNDCEIYVSNLKHVPLKSGAGNAIDLVCYPFYLNIILGFYLQDNENSVYISTYNYHIHYELTGRGALMAEILFRNGKEYKSIYKTSYNIKTDIIKLAPLGGELFRIMLFNNLRPLRGYQYLTDTELIKQNKFISFLSQYIGFSFDSYFDFYQKVLPDYITLSKESIKQTGRDLFSFSDTIKNILIIGGAAIIIYKVTKK